MSQQETSQVPPVVDDADLRIYRLKVTLAEVRPPLWRRLEVGGDWGIDFVAGAVRAGFGWSFCHQSEFTIKGRRYSDSTGWVRFDPEQEYERRYREIIKRRLGRKEERKELEKLSDEIEALTAASESEDDVIPSLSELVPRVRTKFKFLFDFGDWWEHIVEVEKIAPAEPGVRYPRCTDGAGADPIEDCGGAWRLTEIIRCIKSDPQNQLLQALEHLVPKDWDPERFSVEETNQRLNERFPGPAEIRPNED